MDVKRMMLLRKFSYKYFRDPFFYFKVILKELKFFIEYPIYILREFLNIARSLISSILSNSFRTNVFYRKLNGINFKFDFNYSKAFRVRTMFFGMVQTNVIKGLLKYIKKGTVFIDVGASIGYMSAIGAGLVGKNGQVHSFEPLPENFKKLREIVELNKNLELASAHKENLKEEANKIDEKRSIEGRSKHISEEHLAKINVELKSEKDDLSS